MRGGVIAVSAVAALVAAQLAVRPTLDASRRDLGLAAPAPEDIPEGAGARELAGVTTALGSTLGVVRPLAINVLAVRAGALESEGRYFESLALTRGITALMPRLPRVWSHEALEIAYDISVEQPPGDRFDWVLRALDLLREDALAHNPRSPRIYATISLILLQRIGASEDVDLVEAWADAFGAEGERVDAWLGPAARAELAARYLAPTGRGGVDPRSVYAHVLHWCDLGLATCGPPRTEGERASLETLRHHRSFALRFLTERGIVLRPASGPGVAFAPDLRFAAAAFASFRDELRRYEDSEALVEDIRDDLARFARWHVVHRVLWGDVSGARAAFEASGLEGAYEGPESYVLAALRGPGDAADPPLDRVVVGLLRVEAGLRVARAAAGVDVRPLAASLRELASGLHAEAGAAVSFDALRAGALLAVADAWSRAEGGASAAADALRAEARASYPVGAPAPPGPARLPAVLDAWRLDALDPLGSWSGGSSP